MFEYMSFWFAKMLTEFLTGIAIVLIGVFLLFTWFILYAYVIGPYKEIKEMKYWASQTPQWRRNKVNSMNDSYNPDNWPKQWQKDMVEKDRNGY